MKKHDKNEVEIQQEPVKQTVVEQKDQIFIISHQGRLGIFLKCIFNQFLCHFSGEIEEEMIQQSIEAMI